MARNEQCINCGKFHSAFCPESWKDNHPDKYYYWWRDHCCGSWSPETTNDDYRIPFITEICANCFKFKTSNCPENWKNGSKEPKHRDWWRNHWCRSWKAK